MASLAAFGQDPISQTLTKVSTSMATWSNIILVIGLILLGCKYVFADRHDHGSTWTTILGGAILVGAKVLAPYFFGTA